MPVIKRKYLLIGIVFFALAWIIRDSVTQDGPDDLKAMGQVSLVRYTSPAAR